MEEIKYIIYSPAYPTIQSLYENWKDGDLILDPEFQRNYVWDKKKASNLIESIILNIPLPLIFTAEDNSNNEVQEVVDGQQRLTSIFCYIDGIFPDGSNFKLTKKLKFLENVIGGKTFRELSKEYQKKIKKRTIPMIIISKHSQEDIKFDMFERLNTNITSLNAQELRNCLYRGNYNNRIKEIAKYEDFHYILNTDRKKRMLDVELVLMFCAFYHNNSDKYNKSLTQFLNQDMRIHRNLSDDELDKLEAQFKKSVRLIKHIWGKNAFNIYTVDSETKMGGYSKLFNQGLFQILMYWFIPYSFHDVVPYTDLIREELLNLQIHDIEFIDTLTGSGTNSPFKVRKKFDIWGNTIKGILNYPQNDPRAFSYSLKKKLWDNSNICGICSQRISSIDDAEVDHIICYWRGGKTIPENARLTHRYCNRSRSREIHETTTIINPSIITNGKQNNATKVLESFSANILNWFKLKNVKCEISNWQIPKGKKKNLLQIEYGFQKLILFTKVSINQGFWGLNKNRIEKLSSANINWGIILLRDNEETGYYLSSSDISILLPNFSLTGAEYKVHIREIENFSFIFYSSKDLFEKVFVLK